jgi:uncharacterized repeat protein (TIGR03803 family)
MIMFGRSSRLILTVAIAAGSVFVASCGTNGGLVNGQSFRPAAPSRNAEHRTATSASYKVLYRFGARPGDAEGPWAGLLNVNGTLYGTTFLGGDHGVGTVYSISTTGAEAVLHSFGAGSDGNFPKAGLIEMKGALYGTTYTGGTSDNGTVYSVSTGGTEAPFYNFGGGSDGENPYAGLFDARGSLIGTTFFGGSKCHVGCGTIYKISASGAKTVLHDFAGAPDDGMRPESGLISLNGSLYGTTIRGGSSDQGTV